MADVTKLGLHARTFAVEHGIRIAGGGVCLVAPLLATEVNLLISQLISLRSAVCARRYKSGRCMTSTRSGQIARASGTPMMFVQPAAFASLEQAMMIVD